MFGMGTTLNLSDFALILKQPKNIFFGILAQYFVMPFLAFVLSRAFQLEPALAVGVVSSVPVRAALLPMLLPL